MAGVRIRHTDSLAAPKRAAMKTSFPLELWLAVSGILQGKRVLYMVLISLGFFAPFVVLLFLPVFA